MWAALKDILQTVTGEQDSQLDYNLEQMSGDCTLPRQPVCESADAPGFALCSTLEEGVCRWV